MIPKVCFDMVKKWEGCRLTPYLCSGGVPTIGYGATYYLGFKPVSMKDPAITQEQAEELLQLHLKDFYYNVDRMIAPELNDNQMAACVSLAYNIGLTRFGTSTVLRRVNADPLDPKIFDAFLLFNKVNGKLNRGVANRRVDEAKLYFLPVA